MANRNIVTRSGKAASLNGGDYDQNVNSLNGTTEQQIGTTYEVVYTDNGKTIELNNAAMTCTLDAVADIHTAMDSGLSNFIIKIKNINAADADVVRSGTDTVDGATSITLSQYESIIVQTDSTGGLWNILARGFYNKVNTNVTGDVTGNLTGNVTGDVIGNVTGNVTGNASTASKWATTRTIAISGDATSSAINIDGSGNVSVPVSLAANTVKANEIHHAVTRSTVSIVNNGTWTPAAGTYTWVTTQTGAVNLRDGGGTWRLQASGDPTSAGCFVTDGVNIRWFNSSGVTATVYYAKFA